MRLPPLTGRSGLTTLTTLPLLATTVACGGGTPPELAGLQDQVAQVGTELKIDLNGTDVDGDKLAYSFAAPGKPDLKDEAILTRSPSGSGVFRWTPLAADVGTIDVDFIVSDGDNDTKVSITIEVKSAIGSATAPLFRAPLGSGTTLDLTQKKCLDFDVVVEDQDTAQVTLALEGPPIEGMELNQEDGVTAKFHWCPTKEQEGEPRYTITLSADDAENPKTIKNYLIVLRGNSQPNCPGAAPAITHTAMNAMTIVPLEISATVTDDKGLKEAPLFYYSETDPGPNPNLGPGGMQTFTSERTTGNAQNGTYRARFPNPVAGMPAGTSKTIYYLIVADDDDDETGNCDHSTKSAVYSMTVTSNGAADLPVCAPCDADSQCGAGDLCVYDGTLQRSYCLQQCGPEGACPTGYGCSNSPVRSINGAMAQQCLPANGSCAMPTAPCVDDGNEEDDDRTQASANAQATMPLRPGDEFEGWSCPKPVQPTFGSLADDDWRQFVIDVDTKIDMLLYGDGASDLDLNIYTAGGTVVSRSTSLTADENIVKCLKPGTYYLKINGFTNARSQYLFDFEHMPQSCDTGCTDDGREDDNTYSQARVVPSFPFSSTGNTICPNNDDWYRVRLTGGQKLIMDLAFVQSNYTQDLDFHLYDQGGVQDLWPCTPEDPTTCSTAHGQGAVSNEHAEFTAPSTCGATGCTYFVVVRGFDGASNAYDINLRVQ